VRDNNPKPVYGPAYANNLTLIGRGGSSGIIFVYPPEDFKGEIDLTAVDLSPSARGRIDTQRDGTGNYPLATGGGKKSPATAKPTTATPTRVTRGRGR
jgi:hypothetical protein